MAGSFVFNLFTPDNKAWSRFTINITQVIIKLEINTLPKDIWKKGASRHASRMDLAEMYTDPSTVFLVFGRQTVEWTALVNVSSSRASKTNTQIFYGHFKNLSNYFTNG